MRVNGTPVVQPAIAPLLDSKAQLMMRRSKPFHVRLRSPGAALGLFALLAVLHLWPLSAAPWRQSLNYNADAQYNAWAIAWIDRALATNPTGLFDANIFYPEPRTLVYSHPIVVPALVGAPVLALGGSPVLAFNVSLFVGLVLTAWAMWFVARDWTGSSSAALVAGALASFNVQLLTHLPHITAAHAWGLPLSLYLADRVSERPTRRTALALAAVVALVAGTSLYWLAMVGIIIMVSAVARGLPIRRTALMAAASILGLILALPLLWPYIELGAEGTRRPLSMVADFSAEITGYLSSTSVLHAGWTSRFYRDDLNAFFAGFTAIGLAVLGLVAGCTTSIDRRRRRVLVIILLTGVVLSLGPATPIYRALYEWVLPLQGLRAVAQFGFLLLAAVALGAAYGLAWLERRMGSARRAGAVVALAMVAVTAEVWQGPVRTWGFRRVPPIYSLLAHIEGPVVLAEVPFWPPETVHFNGEYVLGSTLHWRPLMNGTSGLTPMSYRRRADLFWYFPEHRAIEAMRKEGVTHVMVHLERFETEAPMVVEALAHQRDLRLIAADRTGHRLYALQANEPKP